MICRVCLNVASPAHTFGGMFYLVFFLMTEGILSKTGGSPVGSATLSLFF